MHQETSKDGEVLRQFFVEDDEKESVDQKLKRLHAEAIANPNVAGIIQR